MDKAFTYMFKDNKFAQKAATSFILSALGVILTISSQILHNHNELIVIASLLGVLGFIISLIPCGFFCIMHKSFDRTERELFTSNV